MELSELEALALGPDRAAALKALLPGTTEHDYWRGVLLQHEGRLDEVDALLGGWAERHRSYDAHYERLARRQLLARARADLPGVAERLLEETRTALDDRAEEVVQAQRHPTSLDPARLDERLVIDDAIRRRSNLDDLTDAVLPDIVRTPSLLPGFERVRRTILQRLRRVDIPGTLDLVAADLADEKGSNGRLGALPIHGLLTQAQLEELAQRLPYLRTQSDWVEAMLARLAPPVWVDLRTDREERARTIDRAYAFAQTLAPTFNTLKATLLFHRLELDRAAGVYDRDHLRAYVELPRQASWIPRARLQTFSNDRLVQPGTPAAKALGLEPIGNDEPLLVELLSRFLLEDDVARWSDVLDAEWLRKVAAMAKLLAGATGAEAEKWTRLLSPAEREALKEHVDIDLAAQNPPRFRADDDVTLEVDVKNVRELEVKVFRIDAVAYWLSKEAEVDPAIDLDGMVPSGEPRKLTFDPSPFLRHRVRIELPECKRPGTYVVELIGNGRSSRALLRKGALRHVARRTAAGLVVTVMNEDGEPLPAARLWLGGREIAPRDPAAGAGITLPFATSSPRAAALLVHGDVTQCVLLERPTEDPRLSAGFHVERESLVANQTAHVLACPRLTLGAAPASLALLTDPRVDIAVTLLDGTASSRTEPVVLRDDEDLTLDLPIPEGATILELTLRAQLRLDSRQETVEVSDGISFSLNTIHQSELTSTVHLSRVAGEGGVDRYLLSLLGKTGEPLPGRAIALALTHRAVQTQLLVTLETDERGTIDLGALDGKVTRLVATSSGQARTWDLTRAEAPPPRLIHALEGEPIVLSRTGGTRSVDDLVLMEHRRGVNVADRRADLVLEARTVHVAGLPCGEYRVDFPEGASTFLLVLPKGRVHEALAAGAAARAWTCTRDVLFELTDPTPLLRSLEVEGDEIVLRLSGVTPETRVHFVGTRFVSNLATPELRPEGVRAPRGPQSSHLVRGGATYVSGRDIGDEYRYVLERRRAPKRPGMMLEKPSLLLHPWALRTTETARIEAARGAMYQAGMMPPGAPAPAAMRMASRPRPATEAVAEPSGFVSVDFLAAGAVVVANQEVDGTGALRVPRALFGPDAQRIQVLVADPGLGAPTTAELTLAPSPARARDLRLRLALDPARHYHEARRIEGVPAGTSLVVPDVRTGKIELLGTLGRAHQLLVTRMADPSALQELAFVTEWPALDPATRRARYGKYACHELNVFLWRKDPAFFQAVVRPSLAHKREKTLVDRFLLGEDLAPLLEAWSFGRLNTLERILVATAIPAVRASVARLVGDAVDLLAPDPEGDARLVSTLLGAAALEVGGGAMPPPKAVAASFASMDLLMAESDEDTGAAMRESAKLKKKGRRPVDDDEPGAARAGASAGRGGVNRLDADLRERSQEEAMFRSAEKTQEWAEVQWWKRRLEEIDSSLVAPNRFWRDLAAHLAGGENGPFLSPHVGLCTGSFAEAMCALAFLDLPFVATPPETTLEDTRFTLVTKSHALAASSSLVELEAPSAEAGSSVLVGQSYVRSDDRWEWHEGEQREKRVTGELIAGVVYRCLVVVTNPTSTAERLEVLLQIPKGAMPVDSGFITRTMPLALDPYATESFDYAFYFPAPGAFPHFPAHVTRRGLLVAHASPRELAVVSQPSKVDLASWSHVSQHGSLDDVLGFLERANLGRTDLGRIAWRMHEPEAFRRVTDLLAARHSYDERLWAYALRHGDRRRAEEWLRHQDDFLRVGFSLEGFLDPAVRGWYQHLEYAPLVNARAHRLGAQRRIPNAGLDAQYRAFLDRVAHRPVPSADDLLAAAHYLLAMDRVEDALPILERIPSDAVTARMQHDYLSAYVACYRGDVATARTLAERWLSPPNDGVDRWRNRFLALVRMIEEIGATGGATEPGPIDPDSRDQKMASAAARQPALDVAASGGEITITHSNLDACQLRFFKLDLELVFSRQPFVQSDVERFSFIEPGLVLDVPLGAGPSTSVPIPGALRGSNVVIEAAAPGLRRSVAYYAHDLGVHVAQAFGQLKVVRASTGAPLAAVYVKVYSRERGGRVVFYKDGYTDLRGRFDYATLSTDDLDRAERFALLVASDDAGATIAEAAPPPR